MKILAIDTTTKFLCLGVYDNNKIYEYNLEVGRKLSSLVTLTIGRVLDASGLEAKDIDYFACGLGPGSFTGVRVGLATIKGMCWALKRPLIGISSLDILARNVSLDRGRVMPIIDAKRNLIYCSAYEIKDGKMKRISPYMLLNLEGLLKRIKKNTLVLGDALSLYQEDILRQVKGVAILGSDYWYPKAHNIISLALERIKAKKLDNPFKIGPIYLYPKECQIRISHMANRKSQIC